MPVTPRSLRILQLLKLRLEAIDGTGDFFTSAGERVHLRRASYDGQHESLPALFLTRRAGGDERSVFTSADQSVVNASFTVVGVLAEPQSGAEPAEEVELLLADIIRALELKSDPYLRDPDTGKNLLKSEPTLSATAIDPPQDGMPVAGVQVDITCSYAHTYGEP